MTTEFKTGDLITMPYGFEIHEFYVWDQSETRYCLGKRSWCVSTAMWVPKDRVHKSADFLRRGRLKWYWRFLFIFGIRDIVCPYK